jgi:hypothetical protein
MTDHPDYVTTDPDSRNPEAEFLSPTDHRLLTTDYGLRLLL